MAIKLGLTDIDTIMLGGTAVQRVMLGSIQLWAWEKVVTLANSTLVDIQSLFSAEDWASPKRKRVVIPAGVTIGSTTVGTAALRTGTGWVGELVIENYGSIQGAGGAANSGTGGNAFQADAAGVNLINSGTIYAGGGGGGLGGLGGSGQEAYNYREPASGWHGNASVNSYAFYMYGAGTAGVSWGSFLGAHPGTNDQVVIGSWTYLRGPSYFPNGQYYSIARQQTRYNPTAGGAGGAGGAGRGYNQTQGSGIAGSAGGTNAGTGGTGGTGGDWGASGAQGANGGNGNVANGAAGTAGGLAGFAIVNPENVILTDTGTILGR